MIFIFASIYYRSVINCIFYCSYGSQGKRKEKENCNRFPEPRKNFIYIFHKANRTKFQGPSFEVFNKNLSKVNCQLISNVYHYKNVVYVSGQILFFLSNPLHSPLPPQKKKLQVIFTESNDGERKESKTKVRKRQKLSHFFFSFVLPLLPQN